MNGLLRCLNGIACWLDGILCCLMLFNGILCCVLVIYADLIAFYGVFMAFVC